MTNDAGFEIYPSIFGAAELAPVLASIALVATSRTAGARHLMRIPRVRQFAEDPRLLRIAAQFVGSSPTPFKATLFDKSRDANWLVAWHQDTALPVRQQVGAPGWGPWSMKSGVLYAHAPDDVLQQIVALRIHLDDSTHDNGPLRVLPQTHVCGRLTDEQISELAREITPVQCVVDAGGVIAMRPLLLHASSKSQTTAPRRVLHLEYAGSAGRGAGVELAIA
ncbi:MAG: phytanoyl-CoA dioxygenase family protein [Planctomycetota bacterium]